MEEENIDTPVPEQTPKKRGRKPKAEGSGAEVAAPKKRGRPRKTADAAEAPESAGENAAKSLDEVLDTAVRQRKAGGRKAGSAAPRQDGPAWRDAPAPSQETPESSESGENEIFVHSKGDDFEYTKADEQSDDIPTSFSTTDDDLDPDSYRNAAGDDDSDGVGGEEESGDESDDDRRIAEARELEKAADEDGEISASQQDRQQRWQKRGNNKFDRRQQFQQNNRGQQNNRQNRQDFRNKNARQNGQQNGNNRNQQRQNQQQQQRQNQQRQNQQKKSRWTQPQNDSDDFINPADLPEWNILKSEKLLAEKLAQVFFGKTPSWELETFEAATPVQLDGTPIPQEQAQEAAPEEKPLESAQIGEQNQPEPADKKPVSEMNYWEVMAGANDAAAKKFALEQAPAQSGAKGQEQEFDEPNFIEIEGCGKVEALGGFDELARLGLREIREKFGELNIEYNKGVGKSEMLALYFKHALAGGKLAKVSGTLDVFQDGLGGAITYPCDNYRLKRNSVYVPQMFIDKFSLKRGHTVSVLAMPPREFGRENCPYAVSILSVMGGDPDAARATVPFTDLVPYYPTRRIILESPEASKTDSLPMRAVDLLTPIGFGQRALIVAPPRTGKTVLMQGMAKSIRINAPDAHLIVLLVDERPEEVTDFKRSVDAEVIASTFDEEASNHVHAAEMVISRARRMVEKGKDVVILLDSITRLARAYNALMPNGGRTMSGGVEANALQKPKKFFGSARNIESGGSLTIIGTALVETGSKMDEVIFEEFKGTGNLELHLDRALSDKRIFPAINIEKSGTRKEELLYHPDEMSKIYTLRRAMKGVPTTEAMEMLVKRLRKTSTNVEFLLGLNM